MLKEKVRSIKDVELTSRHKPWDEGAWASGAMPPHPDLLYRIAYFLNCEQKNTIISKINEKKNDISSRQNYKDELISIISYRENRKTFCVMRVEDFII